MDGKLWHVQEYQKFFEHPYVDAYYLDSNFQVKDSSYTSYYDFTTKKIKTCGNYVTGLKNGLWRSYSVSGKVTDSSWYTDGHLAWYHGYYEDGKLRDTARLDAKGSGLSKGYWKNGTVEHSGQLLKWKQEGNWTYFNQQGRLCAIESMQDDSIKKAIYYDRQGKNPIVKKPPYGAEADYPGGNQRWQYYLNKSLSARPLPDVYLDGKVDGVVQIAFSIDTSGNVVDAQIISSVHPDLDSLAIQIIRSSKQWKPSMEHNRVSEAVKIQPVIFAKLRDE